MENTSDYIVGNDTNSIIVLGNNNGGAVMVDTTNYSKIISKCISGTPIASGLYTVKEDYSNIANVALNLIPSLNSEIGADISNLSGKYYLYTRANDTSVIEYTFVK